MNAEEVAKIRKRLGIGTREMARLLGVSPAAVSRWERGTLEVAPVYERLLLGLKQAPAERVEKKPNVGAMIAAGAAVAAFAFLAYGLTKGGKSMKKGGKDREGP
jgi:DNA-binding XRE family transcriptional regulator